MRRVLFVTPAFLPENHISARRPAGLAKYLREFGWEVTVLTQCEPAHLRDPVSPEELRREAGLDESRVLRIVRSVRPLSANPLLKAMRGIAEYWVLPGSDNSRTARQGLRQARGLSLDVDAIWATAPGYSVFLIASGLSRRLGVPWVADFRDIAEKYVVYPWWVRKVMAWREARFCRTAARITTIEPNAHILSRRHRAPITFISNGFDPEQLCEAPGRPEGDVFRIVYTGTIQGRQDPGPILQAVDELVRDGAIPASEIAVEFHGCLGRRARRACLPEARRSAAPVRQLPWVPNAEALRVQRGATVLLSLGIPGAPCVLPGKLFEYMAAGRPVLAYPSDPEGVDPLLASTGIGRACGSVAEAKAVLLGWHREWKGTGDIRMDRRPAEIQKWSRREQAGALGAVLDSASPPGTPCPLAAGWR
ncbi:MAG TPA: glycosyltransferase [Planctomycetota bacterium]|nr:glycosyltransferase [Planctomycetota bacterium]HRR80682.1 glycosyltransferase [Planctomycetota bacterium]HRT93270.1 glycosyltransferase [Planctomycetota bacterium]